MGREGIDIFAVNKVQLIDQEYYDVNSKQSFVMVFVRQGAGTVDVGDHQYVFKKNKLFVMKAGLLYRFVSKRASLVIIRCPIDFVDQIRVEADRIETCDNLNKLNYISNNYHSKAGCIFRSDDDLNFAIALIDNLLREYEVSIHQNYLIIRQSIAILLSLIARNLIMSDTKELEENSTDFLVMKVVSYIQQHIKDVELVKVTCIAGHFGISKNYFGEFFKKNVGVSYQNYLLDYRLKLVETRLRFSNMRLKEIAHELNFNDESHLSKLFKKHRGVTPSHYRNKKSNG